MNFVRYMLAREKTATARAEYNAAASRLELARIHERLAELASQHEPMNSIGNREECYRAAFYAVIGRMP